MQRIYEQIVNKTLKILTAWRKNGIITATVKKDTETSKKMYKIYGKCTNTEKR